MSFLYRIFFWVGIMTMLTSAKIPLCTAMTQGETECDPYVISFSKATEIKKRPTSLRHRSVTGGRAPIEEKIGVKNGMMLHHLVSKYIKREEQFYNQSERKKSQLQNTKKIIKNRQETPRKEIIQISLLQKETKAPKETLEHKKSNESGETEETLHLRDLPEIAIPTPEVSLISMLPPALGEESQDRDTQPLVDAILPVEPLETQGGKPNDSKQSVETELAVYIVKKGDSVIGISKRFGVERKVLIEINQLDEDLLLKVGQKLSIPISQEDVDAISNAVYIVKKGDTLSGIAEHFRVKISDLKKYNKVKKKSVIHIGQILVLPVPRKLAELKRIEALKQKAILKKKQERERLARIALKKANKARFLKLSKGLKHKLSVTATAYTSHYSQTDKTPFLAAWNNRIRPGMKIIAVSRDLIYRYGIGNGKKVRISGLPGIYTVRDKMNKKWRHKIDIYMGTNRRKALRWGRRRVTLYY